MSKPMLGVAVGAVLGVLDGLSAWFSPEARPMLLVIVMSSTIKGLVTGLLAGLIARRKHSTALGVFAGLVIGVGLSSIVAIGQANHYLEIVLPGMLVGGLVGFVTQRYPQNATSTQSTGTAAMILVATTLSPAFLSAHWQLAPQESLAPLAALVGRWTGTTEGQPGTGTVEREYEWVLGSRFVQVHTVALTPRRRRTRRAKCTRTSDSSASTRRGNASCCVSSTQRAS